MSEESKRLVVLVTKGIESELSSVAFTIANGGITAGLKVSSSSPAPLSISFAAMAKR